MDANIIQAETLQALLHAAVDGIISIDLVGRITSCNPAAERLFACREAAVVGRNIRCLMPRALAEQHDGFLAAYQQTGERRIIGIGRRVMGQTLEGRQFPMELSVGEIRQGEEAVGYIGIIRDITDRVQAEEDAKENREQLAHVTRLSTMGEMAAGIAHEVNQPLTAIASYAQASQRLLASMGGAAASEAQLEKISGVLYKIDQQAQRASEVIKKLRRFVTKQSGEYEPTDIAGLIDETLALARTDTRLLDCPVALSVAEGLAPVLADGVQIQQVLLNLIRNAVDATESSVRALESERQSSSHCIRIDVTPKTAAQVQVCVRDYGVGVSAEIAERLFHPFQTTKASGMGIGLCVSRSIIRAHGGELWFECPEKDGGASFLFTLPYYH